MRSLNWLSYRIIVYTLSFIVYIFTKAYFDVANEGPSQGNGVHNHVNTRNELRSYDPGLYNLVQDRGRAAPGAHWPGTETNFAGAVRSDLWVKNSIRVEIEL